MRKSLIGFIAIVQSVILFIHFLLYETWAYSAAGKGAPETAWIKVVLAVLSVSFVAASVLAYRYTNAVLRAFYRVAAVWLGMLTFLVFAMVSAWMFSERQGWPGWLSNFHRMVEWLFAAAMVAGLCGVINASWTRITRTTVRLANLPATWRGRRAALISDLHLGHVRNGIFCGEWSRRF